MILPLLLALPIALLTGCNSAVTVKPERKDITQAVYASGKVLPLNHYVLYPKAAGYVVALHVRAGDPVRTGDRLITLRNDVNEYSISSSENTAELARRNADEQGPVLSALRQELEASRSRYELDSLNFRRNSALLKEEAISRSAWEQSEVQVDVSRSVYNRSRANYLAAKDRFGTEYMNARNQKDAQRSNRNDYELLSAINGKVYDIMPEVGDLVGLQSPLADLGDASRFEVELSVDETDIGYLQTGQKVIYGIDAYPDQPFEGVITAIIPKVTATSKSSRAKATIQVPEGISFYSGMTVEGNIIIRSRKNALVIPREYVKNGNEVKVKGEDAPRHIKKGLEDLEYVEVLEGLSENETLIK
jgi:multidrug efflux pump subunit AcrA (membrane-fusion protein)